MLSPFVGICTQGLAAVFSPEMNLLTFEEKRFGPYVDTVEYDVITREESAVSALQDGNIDLIGHPIDPNFLGELQEAENIEVEETLKNSYGYLTINCRKYPYNITTFRRALALAISKREIVDQVFDELASPLDSCVPKNNPFSVESELGYHYYNANIAQSNEMLDAAGFIDVDGDNLREAPNGADFTVLIEGSSSDIADEIKNMIAATLGNLRIDAYVGIAWSPWNRLYFHGDYDIMFLRNRFNDFDVDWLGYEYWSEYSNKPFYNYPNFQNSTYDSWRNQLLHSTDYEKIQEAAIEMQRILVKECPIVVLFQEHQIFAYRADRFTNIKNDVVEGISGYWTNYEAHLRESNGGPFGGVLKRSIQQDVDTFNFMDASSHSKDILNMLYDSLIKRNWAGEDIAWLAKNYYLETHEDNQNVPDGHTRITFNLFQNISWSDGRKLTATDVAYTLDYYRQAPGNPYGSGLQDMTSAVAKGPTILEVQFENESYWHLHSVGYKPILPAHIFSDIGSENWMDWNPEPQEETMVTSGPFNITSYRKGDYYNLTYNPHYFRDLREYRPVMIPLLTIAGIGVVAICVAVVVVTAYQELCEKGNLSNVLKCNEGHKKIV
jgi:ABC-type transport system substrate-binding protein